MASCFWPGVLVLVGVFLVEGVTRLRVAVLCCEVPDRRFDEDRAYN